MNALKLWLAQYRLYAELAALVILCIAAYMLVMHIESIGADKVNAANAKIIAAKAIHNDEVERRAIKLSAEQVGKLKAQLAAPPALDAPHLSVRINTPSACAMREDAGSGSSAHAIAALTTMVQRPSEAVEDDIGPDIDKRFADDDALIEALQQRIELERGVCR